MLKVFLRGHRPAFPVARLGWWRGFSGQDAVWAQSGGILQEGGERDKVRFKYEVNRDGRLEKKVISSEMKDLRSFRDFATIFLPKDFETSVGPSYVSYVQWTMAASVIGTAAGVLSMQSLLMAVGLKEGAIPLAATLNWILKDGLGQLGGVLFAGFVNQRFDSEPKRWRFKSALLLDASTLMEVLTPLFPSYFLPIASVANIGKNIGWLSASATRAGIHRSFMRNEENMGDITGKSASQTIAASVIGTGLGIGISQIMGAGTMGIFAATASLSALHLASLYKGLNCVTVRTLNLQRLWLAVRPSLSEDGKIDLQMILEPDKVSEIEKMFHFGRLSVRSRRPSDLELPDGRSLKVQIGSTLDAAFSDQETLRKALNNGHEKYLLNKSHGIVHLVFLHEALHEDVIKGVVHAFLLANSNGRSAENVPFQQQDFKEFLDSLRVKHWDSSHEFFEPFRARLFFTSSIS